MHQASLHEIFCSLFPDELLAFLVKETNRYYDHTVAALGGECKKAMCIYPCFKRFHTLTVYKAECTDAFHSLPQVPVGSGVQEARQQQYAAECARHLVLGILPPTP